jgi:pyrroloquinoline quinone (PQQ) biosynthesis protein C
VIPGAPPPVAEGHRCARAMGPDEEKMKRRGDLRKKSPRLVEKERRGEVPLAEGTVPAFRAGGRSSLLLDRRERVDSALSVFQQIRKTLTPIEAKLLDHPFLRKVEGGRYSKAQVAVLPMEEYHIVSSDLASSKHLYARFKDAPSGAFFCELAENEQYAQDHIRTLAEALGCRASTLEDHEPDPRCQVYPSYFARLALHGSEAEVLVAFASNFSVWWSACRRVAEALAGRYGVPREAVAFLNPFHEIPPPDAPFDALAFDAIRRGLAQGVAEKAMVRVARLIQSYELLFWDALEALAGAPEA